MGNVTEDMVVDYIVNDIKSLMDGGASKDDAIEHERYHLDVIIDIAANRIKE